MFFFFLIVSGVYLLLCFNPSRPVLRLSGRQVLQRCPTNLFSQYRDMQDHWECQQNLKDGEGKKTEG